MVGSKLPTIVKTIRLRYIRVPEYRTPEEFIKSLSPTPGVDQVVEGDLNGDGLNDRVIQIGQQEHKLYILMQTASQGFLLTQASKSGGPDLFDSANAIIKNGSVYVSVSKENVGMSGYYNARYQFKLYRGVWRILGFTHTAGGQSYPTPDTPPDAGPTVRETQVDVNLLTGDIIVAKRIMDDQGDRTAGKTHYKAPSRTCLLEDFAYEYLHCVRDWKTQDGREVSSLMYY